MTNLFQQILALNETVPGWCPIEKSVTLASMIVAIRPKVSMEIGVYAGKSFFPMALAHKALNYGRCWGIDAWSTAVGVEAQVDEDSRRQWSGFELEVKYNQVLLKVAELGLENYVNIIRHKSDDVSPTHVGLLHVDGAHNEQAIKDVQRFAPFVERGGFCIVDDLEWGNKDPKKAAALLPGMGFQHLYGLGGAAVYQRL